LKFCDDTTKLIVLFFMTLLFNGIQILFTTTATCIFIFIDNKIYDIPGGNMTDSDK
jgi:orotidine-5'-phosphate decarboxylase